MTSSIAALGVGLGLGSALEFNSSKKFKNSYERNQIVVSATLFKGDSWQRQSGRISSWNQRIVLPLSDFHNFSEEKWSRNSLVFRCRSQERGGGEEAEGLAAELPRPVLISTSEDGGIKNGSIEKFSEGNGKITETVVVEKQNGEGEREGEVIVSKSGQWQKRWTIVGLCFFAFLLCNMDRVNMSIAILPMQEAYQWQPATVGLVQSSFFWGYLLTQVAGGIWADSIGGKQVLGFGVIWWSLATLFTPIAANLGLPALLFARACMGVGEGVAMPAMNNLLSQWVPVSERSRSLAFVYSGMYLGSVIGLSFSPFLIQSFGWPSVFYSFGSLGTVWMFFWQKKAFNSPDEDPTLSTEERQTILLARSEGGLSVSNEKRVQNIPWRLLLSKTPVWAIIICHFCHNWGTFILLTWMPSYYRDVLHFNLAQSGFFSVLPWLTMAISANVGGWIADTLISRGTDITLVRKIMQTIGFLGPAFCLWQLPNITSPPMAVLCMMASQGMDAFSQSGLYSNHQDIGPRYSGVLLGISNTAGVLAGVLGTYLTGQILQHGSWDEVFKVAVGLYLVGAVVWNVAATGKRVFD